MLFHDLADDGEAQARALLSRCHIGFEQPLSVETVDIMPTLAATIGLKVSGQDGRCLDLDPGPADTCRR